METTRHFTTSVYIVHDHKVLLHWHRKLELWLPVGGHIDRDELPEEVALREVQEESGLTIRFRNSSYRAWNDEQVRRLIQPEHVLLQTIQPGHQHIDFVFYAQSDSDKITPETGLPDHYRWIASAELDQLPLVANVRFCAQEILHLYDI